MMISVSLQLQPSSACGCWLVVLLRLLFFKQVVLRTSGSILVRQAGNSHTVDEATSTGVRA